MKIFTIGYLGWKKQSLIEVLKKNGIKTLVDVRRSPKSKNPDWDKSSILTSCRLNGMEYVSFTNLGLEYKDWHNAEWRTAYKKYAEENIELTKQQLSRLTQPIALMCKEKKHVNCHRSILAEVLKNHNCDIIHIKEEGEDSGTIQTSRMLDDWC
mgnify:FL=1|tara:strand:- start:267 stop:728 length:462 start_codon:yes stop_codon:yes gene_type:complete